MKPAAHLLVGHAVRVTPPDRRPLATSDGVTVRLTLASTPAPEPPFDGVLVDVHSAGCFMVLRTDDGSVGFWGAEYVRFTDPERAARVLRANAAAQDVTTDGRTLSQVCTELVEAKQTASRLNDALRDLAVELDLPMGLPENALVKDIRTKVVYLRERSLNSDW